MRGFRGAAMVAACAMVVTLGTGTGWLWRPHRHRRRRDRSDAQPPTLPAGWTRPAPCSPGPPVAHPSRGRPGRGRGRWSSPRRWPLSPPRGHGVGAGQPGRHGRPDGGLVGARRRRVGSPPRRGRTADRQARSGRRAVRATPPQHPPRGRSRQPRPVHDGHRRVLLGRDTIAGLPSKVEVKAVVVSPRGTTGSRPLVLFLHGRHATCYKGQQSTADWPCPTGFKPSRATVATSRTRSCSRRRATTPCRSRPTGSTVRTGCSPTAAPRPGPS